MTGLVDLADFFFRTNSAWLPFFITMDFFAAVNRRFAFFVPTTVTFSTAFAPPSPAVMVILALPGFMAVTTPFEETETAFLLPEA